MGKAKAEMMLALLCKAEDDAHPTVVVHDGDSDTPTPSSVRDPPPA